MHDRIPPRAEERGKLDSRQDLSHLSSVLAIVAEAVISVDESQCIVFFNQGAERIFGYRPGEVLGRPLDILLPERYRSAHRAHVDAFAHSSTTARQMGQRLEVRALRSTGEEFPAEASIARTAGPDGTVLTVVLRDVTEQHRAREALARRERQLADAQALAHIGSWSWEVATDTLRWSDELYRIYGLEPGSPMDFARFAAALHPADRDRVAGRINEAMESGDRFEFHHRIIRPDGRIRWLHARGEVARDEAGQPVRMRGTGQDVTRLRRAGARARRLAVERAGRRAAEEAERRMRFLARASAELSSSLDYEATLSLVARLAIPEMADWCAVDLLDDQGAIRRLAVEHEDPERVRMVRRIAERYPPDPGASSGAGSVIRTGRTEHIDRIQTGHLALAARNDEHLAMLEALGLHSIVIAPLVARDRVLGAFTLAYAESRRVYGEEDRRFAEDLARRAAVAIDNAQLVGELARAVRAKTEFMATVSHELRTPLNAILGYTELLVSGIPEAIPDAARDWVHRIGLSGRHLLQLIDEILTFSRLQGDREVAEPAAVELDELLEEIQVIVGPLAESKGLGLEVEAESLPDRVRTDPRKLRQILLNLLGNAVKFTERGKVGLQVIPDTGSLVFRVTDTGPGIDLENRSQLFEPFWQGDQSRTRTLGGAGLGLAISDRFARLLGGSITVESEPGQGSVFTLRIPAGLDG